MAMPDHKHPTAAFWITVALTAVLVYVASFGPACWIVSHAGLSEKLVNGPYWPILWIDCNGPRWLRMKIMAYADLTSAKGWGLMTTIRNAERGDVQWEETIWGRFHRR